MFLFCAICGGLIRHKQRWPVLAPELRWQTKVVLLYDPALEFETLEHHYHAGKLKDAPRLDFRREGPDQDIQKVRAIRADSHSNEFILLGSECHDDGAVAAAANDDNPGGGRPSLRRRVLWVRVRVRVRVPLGLRLPMSRSMSKYKLIPTWAATDSAATGAPCRITSACTRHV